MTVLVVDRVHGRHKLVKGNIRDWLGRNRIPAYHSPMNRGWWVRSERVADLVALAEHQGVLVKRGAS